MTNDPATGRFVAGNVANPGGRPRGAIRGLAEAMRAFLAPEQVVEHVRGLLADPYLDALKKLEIIKWATERGYGRAVQAHELHVVTDESTALAEREDRRALLSRMTIPELEEFAAAQRVVDRLVALARSRPAPVLDTYGRPVADGAADAEWSEPGTLSPAPPCAALTDGATDGVPRRHSAICEASGLHGRYCPPIEGAAA